ncbi:MAG: hypothetical protein R6X02_22585 [Enhygromyxa sp.]
MAIFTPEARNDLSLTADLGERLTLVFVFGPGYLTGEGFDEIEATIGRGRRVVRHRLDRLGPNVVESIIDADDPRPVVLVGGLERMTPERQAQGLESMNLLRDTLSRQPAVVVMWIPDELADQFRRLCVDLFQWRTLSLLVDLPPDHLRRARHAYLVDLATAPVSPPWGLSERSVSVEGAAPQAIGGWLDCVHRGLLLGAPGAGKSTELRRHAARQASAVLDAEPKAALPVLVAARHVDERAASWRALAQAAEGAHDEQVVAWLEQQLASAGAQLLVDGLDELPEPKRATFEDRFISLVASEPGLRVVVATRDCAAGPRWGAWQRARLEPLDAAAIQSSLRRLGLDPQRLASLISGPVAELAGNPLSLRVLAEQLIRGEQPPSWRITTLLNTIVEDRVRGWDQRRGYPRAIMEPAEILLRFLARLAAEMTRERREVLDSTIVQELANVSVLGSPAPRFDRLQPGLERTGLLSVSETGYAFVHELFREYFAGLWLLENHPEPDQLAEHALDPAWHRPIIHALALLPSRELETAFEQIWGRADTLPAPQRWSVRRVALEGALQTTNSQLRERIVHQGLEALDQARRDAEPPGLWKPLAELFEAASLR